MRNFQNPGKSITFSKNGMVATSHYLASVIGLDILKKGGNAVDSIIAMSLALPLCEPQSTGLFGDVFCILKLANKDDFIGLNGSGKSPLKINSDFLRQSGLKKIPETDVCSITLPGAIKSFESLHSKFGNMDLFDICKPAINYAEEGVVVSPRVAFDWYNSNKNLKGIAKKFYTKKGEPFKVGDIFYAPQQAKVLKKFAKDGFKAFYDGEVAEDLINSLNKLGGLHTLQDMNNVTVEDVKPISHLSNNYNLIELPPNGQGITAILITKMFDKFDLKKLDPMGAERIHIETEIVKLAYDMRNKFIADPNFYELNFDDFFSDKIVSDLVSKIDLDMANNKINTTWENHHKDTVYLTCIDKDRNMVSLIFSIFNSFGSGYASEKFGLLFHNRGAGFSLEKGHPNELSGEKRPLHTIIPAFLSKKNDFIMPFGVMGGQYQANGHARLISNIINYGMDVQSAIDFPRSFPENGYLKLEEGYSDIVAFELENKGHKILRPNQPIGGAQAIIYDINKDILMGGSDPRKDGCALGY